MKIPLIATFLLIFAIYHASSLECYSCSSAKSWKDCNVTKSECPPADDQCIKLHFKARGGQLFLKGCAQKLICESAKNPTCKEGSGPDVTCDISCCDDKDNCNEGSALHDSGFILLSCALASLLVPFLCRERLC